MADPLASAIVLDSGGEPYMATCLAAPRQQTYPTLEALLLEGQQVGQDKR